MVRSSGAKNKYLMDLLMLNLLTVELVYADVDRGAASEAVRAWLCSSPELFPRTATEKKKSREAYLKTPVPRSANRDQVNQNEQDAPAAMTQTEACQTVQVPGPQHGEAAVHFHLIN